MLRHFVHNCSTAVGSKPLLRVLILILQYLACKTVIMMGDKVTEANGEISFCHCLFKILASDMELI